MKNSTAPAFWLLLLALTFGIFGCSSGPSSEQARVHVTLRARTALGDPLANVVVRTQGALQEQWTTDERGMVRIESQVKGDHSGDRLQSGGLQSDELRIHAECPEDHVGESVERAISARLLAGMVGQNGDWSLDLVCLPRHPKLPVAILCEGCGDVRVRLGGEELGMSSDGAFHALIDFPVQSSLEFEFESAEKGCQMLEAKQNVVLKADQNALFLQVAATANLPSKVRRSSPKKVVHRPYRL